MKQFIVIYSSFSCVVASSQLFCFSSDNYEPFLKDILHYRWHIEDKRHKVLDNTDSTFGTLSLQDRVQVLLAICHYRLTADDVEGILQVCFEFYSIY